MYFRCMNRGFVWKEEIISIFFCLAIVSAFIKLTLSILLENIPATTFAINGFVFKEDISPLKVILILEIVFSMIWPPNFPNFKDKSINGLSLGHLQAYGWNINWINNYIII